MANFDDDKMLMDDDKDEGMDAGNQPGRPKKIADDEKISGMEDEDLIEGEDEDEENLDAWELESDLEE